MPKRTRRTQAIKTFSKALVISIFISIFSASPANAVTLIPCSDNGSIRISDTTLIDSPGCNGSVEVPSYVTTIGSDALNGVTGLSTITFARGSALTSINRGAFAYTRGLTVVLPEGLTSIGPGSFYNAGVSRITIPASVTSIGADAFRTGSLVLGIYFLGNAPTIGANAFFGVNPEAKAYIRQTATGFGNAGSTWNGIQIAPLGYSLKYHENLSTSGVAPSDPAPIYANGTQVTVLGNMRILARSGYTFAGWSLNTEGSETTYSSGDSFAIGNQDLTLYAKWNADSHAVTFDSKDGSTVVPGSFLTNGLISAPTSPTKSGYTFAGWSATDGGALLDFPYSPGVFTDITLFARWNANSHVVTFDSKGGSTTLPGSYLTNGSISAPTSPTRSGYTFAGWSAIDGGALLDFPYSPGVFTDITLFAKWNADSQSGGSKPNSDSSAVVVPVKQIVKKFPASVKQGKMIALPLKTVQGTKLTYKTTKACTLSKKLKAKSVKVGSKWTTVNEHVGWQLKGVTKNATCTLTITAPKTVKLKAFKEVRKVRVL